MIAPDLAGGAAAQADFPLEGRQRKGAAAQQPCFRLRTHGDGVRPARGQAEGKHGGNADHQRQPGKPSHDHQRQPGKPLAVGNVKHPAAEQRRQIPQSAPDHVSEAGGRGWRRGCPAIPPGAASPGLPPWGRGSAGGQWCGRRPPSRPPGSRNPVPEAVPPTLPWR